MQFTPCHGWHPTILLRCGGLPFVTPDAFQLGVRFIACTALIHDNHKNRANLTNVSHYSFDARKSLQTFEHLNEQDLRERDARWFSMQLKGEIVK